MFPDGRDFPRVCPKRHDRLAKAGSVVSIHEAVHTERGHWHTPPDVMDCRYGAQQA
jgi:hypothetical protein